MRLTILLLATALSGCAVDTLSTSSTVPIRQSSYPDQHIVERLAALEKLQPVTLTVAQKVAVEAAVRSSMKDPDSARFGGFVAGKSKDGTITVCGWVNAKNSFGGYVGKMPFMGSVTAGAAPKFAYAEWWTGASDDGKSSMQTCAAHGLLIPI